MDNFHVNHHDHHVVYDSNTTEEYSEIDMTPYYIVFIVMYLTVAAQLFVFLYMLFRLCRERARRRHMVVVLERLELDVEESNRLHQI